MILVSNKRLLDRLSRDGLKIKMTEGEVLKFMSQSSPYFLLKTMLLNEKKI
jgi:hypothetical protein